jgi:hypothetical protein
VVSRHKPQRKSQRQFVRAYDFGVKPRSLQGQGIVSGSNRKPFELLKGHLAMF